MLIVCAYSLLSRGPYGGVLQPWTIENYQRVFDPLYLSILWRSIWISAISTAGCLVLGFPLALFISRAGKRRVLFLNLVMLPFWTSFLIRTYAWMFLLRDTGLREYGASGTASDLIPAAVVVQRRRRDSRTGLRLSPVHGAAALRHARKNGPGAPGRGAGSRRFAMGGACGRSSSR